jgi:hypothetical protein
VIRIHTSAEGEIPDPHLGVHLATHLSGEAGGSPPMNCFRSLSAAIPSYSCSRPWKLGCAVGYYVCCGALATQSRTSQKQFQYSS